MTLQGFDKDEVILHQGAVVGEHDFLYLLDTGEVDVVISGAGTHTKEEDHKVGPLPASCWLLVAGGSWMGLAPAAAVGDLAEVEGSPREGGVSGADQLQLWRVFCCSQACPCSPAGAAPSLQGLSSLQAASGHAALPATQPAGLQADARTQCTA